MKGFTLLEVMVALAILAGVVMTVLASYNYHLSLLARDEDETEAVLFARAKLDDPNLAALTQKNGDFAPTRPDMKWQIETAPTQLPGISRLTLTVSWNAARSKLSLVEYLQKR